MRMGGGLRDSGDMGMCPASYSYAICDAVEQTNLEDWNQLRAGDDPFMDLRFVATVQRSMAEQGKYWTLIIYDAEKRPAATACLSLLRIDAVLMANALAKGIVRAIRRLWQSYLYLKVLFVGLPVSAGQSHLRIRPDADTAEVFRTLDTVLCELAARQRASVIVLKEFDVEEVKRLDGLREHGYRRADSLAMNHFEPHHANFDEFCAALRKTFRKSIRYSLRKYEKIGLRTIHLTGGEDAEELWTGQMHRLYESVLEHAHARLERLPAEFFRELSRQFADQVVFFHIYQGERIVACACTLLTESVFYMLFAGMDYRINSESDLYFNLTYQQLDFGMRRGVSDIRMGQTADQFRARLGCRQERRFLYVKGRGLTSLAVRTFFGLAFPPVELTPSRAVLRGQNEARDDQSGPIDAG